MAIDKINLSDYTSADFEITEKLNGMSCTMFYQVQSVDPPVLRLGACSRNWEMQLDDDNVYAKLWHELQLEEKLKGLGRNIAIQGEIIGPGIQGNKYKRAKQEFYVFDIYDIDQQRYLSPNERIHLTAELELNHVPIQPRQQDRESCQLTLDIVLTTADGKSQLFDTPREGLVFKHREDPSIRFKAISNKWLLKHE